MTQDQDDDSPGTTRRALSAPRSSTLPASGIFPSTLCARRVGANEIVFMDGDPARNVYEVVEGLIRLCKILADGRRVVLGFVQSGELFRLSPARQHRCTAEAVTDTTLRSCPRTLLETLAERSPKLRAWLNWQIWRELDTMQDRLLQLSRMRPTEQLASFLVAFGSRGSVLPERFQLPMTRTDIADYLGLTIETVSRTMTQLRRSGIIDLPNPQEIVVLRPDALRALAEGNEWPSARDRRPWPARASHKAAHPARRAA